METELISVIVPVYNVERYLRRCVDSILHQTYQDLEILLVDDGSTDASGAICDEYAAQEERVTAVHQKNGGLSAARNAGLERAQGTYLCFVDSDDFLDSRMLETLCRDLQEQDADVAVVGFRMFEREEELAPAELTVPVQCMTAGRPSAAPLFRMSWGILPGTSSTSGNCSGRYAIRWGG